MEIKPIMEKKLPRYAAAIAAVAAAGMLTACQTAGEVETAGVVPEPTEELQLMGEEPVIESSDESAIENGSEIEGSEEGLLRTEGEVALDSGETCFVESSNECVEVEGFVAVIPDYRPGLDAATEQGMALGGVLKEGFAQKEITLAADEGEFDYCDYFHMPLLWRSVGDTQPTLRLAFFDGTDEADGWKQRDYIREWIPGSMQKEYDWGFLVQYEYNADGTYQNAYVLIDLNRCPEMTAEQAAAIAEDVLQ